MNYMRKNISEFRKQILLGFHTQFAENQRTREQSFLKILGFLGAVIFGYAYSFHNYPSQILSIEFSYVTLLSEFLLTFGALIIITISYNFRRDQIVNAKIKKMARVIGDNKIFPKRYDPCESDSINNYLFWMPDFLAVFYYLFPLVQIVLFISFLDKIDACFDLRKPDLGLTILVLLSIISIFLTPFFNWKYFKKLKRFCLENK